MKLRDSARLRALAVALVATSLLATAACAEGNGEGGEEGGQIQEGGEQEED